MRVVQCTKVSMAMIKVGDVVSYMDMCQEEGAALQRGMNYRLGKAYSIVLMSVRVGAPYADKVKEEGSVLIYEGHTAYLGLRIIPSLR